jgi:hypothetical protein
MKNSLITIPLFSDQIQHRQLIVNIEYKALLNDKNTVAPGNLIPVYYNGT